MGETLTDTISAPVFSRDAIIAWARSIGVSDSAALDFFRAEGVVIVDETTDVIS